MVLISIYTALASKPHSRHHPMQFNHNHTPLSILQAQLANIHISIYLLFRYQLKAS
jgi:hypothetical protein